MGESTTFKLSSGQSFTLQLDTVLIRQVRAERDVDLVASDMSGLQKAASDVALLADVLWVLCRDAAVKVGITEEQFGRGIVGDTWEEARRALQYAVAHFFPKRQREIMLAQLAAEDRLEQAGTKAALTRILDESTLTGLECRIREEVDAAMSRILTPATHVTTAKN